MNLDVPASVAAAPASPVAAGPSATMGAATGAVAGPIGGRPALSRRESTTPAVLAPIADVPESAGATPRMEVVSEAPATAAATAPAGGPATTAVTTPFPSEPRRSSMRPALASSAAIVAAATAATTTTTTAASWPSMAVLLVPPVLPSTMRPFERLQCFSRNLLNIVAFLRVIARAAKVRPEWGWEYDLVPYYRRKHSMLIAGTTAAVPISPDVHNATHRRLQGTSGVTAFSSLATGILSAAPKMVYTPGYLPDEMRSRLRVPAAQRSAADCDIIFAWASQLKALQRFAPSIQRDILDHARYERWGVGRTLVREGQKARYFYIILDGEVELIPDEATRVAAMQGPARASYHGVHLRLIGGESFGESGARHRETNVTIQTRKTTEFLLLDQKWYLDLLKNARVHANPKLDQILASPIFRTFNDDDLDLSRIVDMKLFERNHVITTENVPSHYLYIVVRGECAILRMVPYDDPQSASTASAARRVEEEGPAISAAAAAATAAVSATDTPEHAAGNRTASPSAPLRPTMQVLCAGKLTAGAWFGDPFQPAPPCSVVTLQRTEVALIHKYELRKIATAATWQMLRDAYARVRSPAELLGDYAQFDAWRRYRRRVMRERTRVA
ncbi:hypothetical protein CAUPRSCDRAFT_11735 [Caulochytrium protostelioides]|uniref:Cyclic nucleotide-binding domain-containing protein n=1 Tax=Caulochytrium protostelioides TaxID=1555241 RepID=A0A4P9WZ25_9FUNG|nr:hypothetical protein CAUPRSCDRAFT_11735 [Caulochytrium protostelioides]